MGWEDGSVEMDGLQVIGKREREARYTVGFGLEVTHIIS